MGTAQVVDGVAIAAYVNGVAVDSEGNQVKGAPKQPKDADPSLQPGALGAPTPEERMGIALANALQGKTVGGKPAAVAADDDDEEVELPPLSDGRLEEHVAGLKTADEVREMQKLDDRKGAVAIYEARLAELEEE